MSAWACWRCHRGAPHARRCGLSDICSGCRAVLAREGKGWCPGCRRAKPLAEFVKRGYCLVCNPEYQRRQRERNPERYAAEKARKRERWWSDPAFRERDILRRRQWRPKVTERPGYVSPAQAAKALGCSHPTILRRLRAGLLPGAEQEPGPHGRWWIPEEALCR